MFLVICYILGDLYLKVCPSKYTPYIWRLFTRKCTLTMKSVLLVPYSSGSRYPLYLVGYMRVLYLKVYPHNGRVFSWYLIPLGQVTPSILWAILGALYLKVYPRNKKCSLGTLFPLGNVAPISWGLQHMGAVHLKMYPHSEVCSLGTVFLWVKVPPLSCGL